MARIKRFAALMLIGILALGILTGCSEDSIPTTPPETIGQLFVDRVKATVEEVSNDFEEGDFLVYDEKLAAAATSQLKKINDDGTIAKSDALIGTSSTIGIHVYTESIQGSILTAQKLTLDNMDECIQSLKNTLQSRDGYTVYYIGVGYLVKGDNVYIAHAAAPYKSYK